METRQHLKLTAAEISELWAAYQNETMSNCILQHFLEKLEDTEIRQVIQYGLEISQSHVEKLTALFKAENHPVPQGFTHADVNRKAPRLFSDSYYLYYTQRMGKLGLNSNSMAVALAVRQDIHSFFSDALFDFKELHKQTNEVLLSKGLYIRSPHLPIPHKVDFVTKQTFLTGWLGERRPLLAMEVSHLFENIQRNALGATTLMGFSQVATSKQVRQFLIRGKEIASKHNEIFASLLQEDDLPVPMAWDMEVTDSTVAPFSDKLIMFITASMISIGMGYYGTSLSTALRRDLATHYSRLIPEIEKYSEDGVNILIENGWMEQPPQAVDRHKLAKD